MTTKKICAGLAAAFIIAITILYYYLSGYQPSGVTRQPFSLGAIEVVDAADAPAAGGPALVTLEIIQPKEGVGSEFEVGEPFDCKLSLDVPEEADLPTFLNVNVLRGNVSWGEMPAAPIRKEEDGTYTLKASMRAPAEPGTFTLRATAIYIRMKKIGENKPPIPDGSFEVRDELKITVKAGRRR